VGTSGGKGRQHLLCRKQRDTTDGKPISRIPEDGTRRAYNNTLLL
jgi:hypothetical protein